MEQREMVIYVRARCLHSWRARRILRRNGYAFEAVEIGADEESRLLPTETVGRRVPLLFLGGRLVGGFDDIRALGRSGDLDRLVRGRV